MAVIVYRNLKAAQEIGMETIREYQFQSTSESHKKERVEKLTETHLTSLGSCYLT